MSDTTTRTIHFVSLGCPKNRVDSEVMLGVAQQRGYAHTHDADDAEVIVVNTCGFIDAAKQESIDTILSLADMKEAGRCKKLVVTGCLSQRHPEEMAREMPEVDHFLGSSDMLVLGSVLDGVAPRVAVGSPADWLVGAQSPRQLSSRPGSAYVKIAEGCNRSCSFCVIPSLRGKQRSRLPEDIVAEVERLAAGGVKEVNLISQDTIAYGRDHSPKNDLTRLVSAVADVSGIAWVRLFYLYPERIGDGLIELLADHPRVLPYVDMPLQHAADAMLRRMKRGHGGARLRALVERMRERIEGLVFRTAFIVGHPGETEAEFDELCDFVRWARFERIGVFRYSDEDTSHSATLPDKVDPERAADRAAKLMEIAGEIARERHEAMIGQRLEVLVEGPSQEHELVWVGRHKGQAPEIDGQVFLSGTEHLDVPLEAGQRVEVAISQAADHDLVGEVVSMIDAAGAAARRVSLPMLGADNRRLT